MISTLGTKIKFEDHSLEMGECGASFSTLPEELVLKIFFYLRPEDLVLGVRPTCRYFRDLSRIPDLWSQEMTVTCLEFDRSSPTIFEYGGVIYSSKKFYRKLLQQKCIVKESRAGRDGLEANRCVWGNVHTLPVRKLIRCLEERGKVWPSCSVTRHMCFPSLERLKLVRQRLPEMKFLVRYSGLTHLHIHVDKISCGQKLVDNISSVPEKGEYLRIVRMFKYLKELTNLRALTLKLRHCRHFEAYAHMLAVKKAMVAYFSTGPRLRQIELHFPIDDKVLTAILNHCLELEDFGLECAASLSAKAFTAVSETPKMLFSSLKVTYCPRLKDPSLKAISLAFPNLKSLDLVLTTHMTEGTLTGLLKACSQLTTLRLEAPNSEEYHRGQELITGCCFGELAYSRTLEDLALAGLPFLARPIFQGLCQHQPNLRALDLSDCPVTLKDLETLTLSCPLLQAVRLCNCYQLDTSGVRILWENLPHLQTLNFRPFYSKTFQLEELGTWGKGSGADNAVSLKRPPRESKLLSLKLLHCQPLTAANVMALMCAFPSLQQLDLQSADGVNDSTVSLIVRECPQLQYLQLETCSYNFENNLITDACLDELRQWGSNLLHVRFLTYCHIHHIALGSFLTRHPSALRVFTIAALYTINVKDTHDEVHCYLNDKLADLKAEVKRLSNRNVDIGFEAARRTRSRRGDPPSNFWFLLTAYPSPLRWTQTALDGGWLGD
ncbi:hypothetical protein ACOMHN_024274 [Nucella lapillus]